MQRRVAQLQSWDDARLLLALVRAPTLAGAARALGLDKSTVSRRLDALERALAVRLFVRTREGLRPSAVGERLRGHAERIETEIQAFTNAVAAATDEIAGRVRIATTEGLATRLVQNGLLDLRAQFPGLELEVLGGNRVVDLSRGEADLAIRLSPTTDPALLTRVLGRFTVSLFAAPAYTRTRGIPRTPAQLAGHDVLLPSDDLAALPEARWLAARPQVRIAFRSASLPALVEACARGHGIAPITTSWGQATPGLDLLFELATIPARPVWLVMHPDVAKQRAVRFVADRITAVFASLAT